MDIVKRLRTEIHSVELELAAATEIDRLRDENAAMQAHIERLCNRKRFQCQASGCEGCAVCDPVAALRREEE